MSLARTSLPLLVITLVLSLFLTKASPGWAYKCSGSRACERTDVSNIGDDSCNGVGACDNMGAPHVGAHSCDGRGACAFFSKATIGAGSCNGEEACADSRGNVGDHSCVGRSACEEHKKPIGNSSCNAEEACSNSSCTVPNDSCNFTGQCTGNKCPAAGLGAGSSAIDCSNAVASDPDVKARFGSVAENINGITDTSGGYSVMITGVTQDKPVEGPQAYDATISSGNLVWLRAHSEGAGGLIYKLFFTATDTSTLETCDGSVSVCVHDWAQNTCADTNQVFDATK